MRAGLMEQKADGSWKFEPVSTKCPVHIGKIYSCRQAQEECLLARQAATNADPGVVFGNNLQRRGLTSFDGLTQFL